MELLIPSDERRAAGRLTLPAAGITAVRVAGDEVQGIDVSNGGILVESPYRLRPGTETQVHLSASDRPVQLRGRVVRCHVAALGGAGLRYRIAIAFNNPVAFGEPDARSERVDASTVTSMFEAAIADLAAGPSEAGGELNDW